MYSYIHTLACMYVSICDMYLYVSTCTSWIDQNDARKIFIHICAHQFRPAVRQKKLQTRNTAKTMNMHVYAHQYRSAVRKKKIGAHEYRQNVLVHVNKDVQHRENDACTHIYAHQHRPSTDLQRVATSTYTLMKTIQNTSTLQIHIYIHMNTDVLLGNTFIHKPIQTCSTARTIHMHTYMHMNIDLQHVATSTHTSI